MSDFQQQPPSVPQGPSAPPSPFGAPPPPPPPAPPFAPSGPYAQPGQPQYGYAPAGYAPAGYAPYPAVQAALKPPRPSVVVGSVLLVLGGLIIVAGTLLDWGSFRSESFFELDGSFNGFSSSGDGSKDGPVFVFFAVLAISFGITLLLARKVLAVAIVAVVFAVIGLLVSIAELISVNDDVKALRDFGIEFEWGPGLWVILLGSVVALAGAIAALAKRRVASSGL